MSTLRWAQWIRFEGYDPYMNENLRLALIMLGILVAGGVAATVTYKVCDALLPKLAHGINTYFSRVRAEMRANKLGAWHFRHNNEITW